MGSCVINVTRFGDLLQTQAVIAGLARKQGPVELVCLDNFTQAATLLQGLDSIRPVAGAKWLAALDRQWSEGLADLWEWLGAGTGQGDCDGVFNLTPSRPARLLSRLIQGCRVQGFSLDDYGFGLASNPWTSFLEVSSANRGSSPFNMVDVLWRVAGFGAGSRPYNLAPVPQGQREKAQRMLSGKAPVNCKGFVGFQLGASREERCWPAGSFARLGRMVWEKFSLCPVLLGTPDERSLAEVYSERDPGPHIDLVGRTGLGDLAGALSIMRALVSNDTGTMHLAAGLDIPVLALFLATAQPWDTGPYSPGNICLEPDLDCHPCDFSTVCPNKTACRRTISPETAFSWLSRLLQGQHPADPVPGEARAWLTGHDWQGWHRLDSLSGHEGENRTQWMHFQREIYRRFLDDEPLEPKTLPRANLDAQARRPALAAVVQGARLLTLLEGQLSVLERSPRTAFKNKVLATLHHVEQLWQHSEYLNVLGLLWQQQAQQTGRDIREFKALILRYRSLCHAAQQVLSGKDED